MHDDRAEVDGPIAPTASVAVSDVRGPAAAENSSPNPFAVRGFQKGYDPRRNTAGRIKKAPTVLDELKAQAHQAKHRRKLAQAWLDTAEAPHTAAGQRAREALSDRLYGLPKQTLVLEQGDSPLLAFLARQQAREQLPYVEGSAQVLPPDASADEPT